MLRQTVAPAQAELHKYQLGLQRGLKRDHKSSHMEDHSRASAVLKAVAPLPWWRRRLVQRRCGLVCGEYWSRLAIDLPASEQGDSLSAWLSSTILENKGLSAGSVRNVYDVTARVFASAVDDRVIAHTPCRKIRLPKDHTDELDIPSVEEVAAIAEAIGDRWRAMVVTLAGSGLRIGELRGLAVEDVDFLRRTIHVRNQRDQAGNLRPLKSKASRRPVPVGQVVIDALAAHLAAYPSDGGLFLDELGEPVPYWRWKKLLAAATKTVGVKVTAHGFRHFYASALIAGGATVKQVQTVLGHASAVITLRTYAHLWPGDEDRVRDVADAALSPLADSLRTEAASE